MIGDDPFAPIAVVAGVSLGSYKRSHWRPARTGWQIHVLPGREHGHGSLSGIWKRVLGVGDEYVDRTDAGVHFLLAHDREDERRRFRHELRRRSFRVVWLDRRISRQYGSEPFRQMIETFLDFEEQWRQYLRPKLTSPLLLPESAFTAAANVRDTWRRVHNVVVDHDSIYAVDHSISRFIREHKKNPGWVDSRRLLFSRGAPHGMHGLAAWQRQKLGFLLPNGFHYDVKHEQKRSFSLCDQEGTRQPFVEYTNVDPHGFIRGGR